jgi:hypothetical protein
MLFRPILWEEREEVTSLDVEVTIKVKTQVDTLTCSLVQLQQQHGIQPSIAEQWP